MWIKVGSPDGPRNVHSSYPTTSTQKHKLPQSSTLPEDAEYIPLTTTAHWMVMADHLMDHGHPAGYVIAHALRQGVSPFHGRGGGGSHEFVNVGQHHNPRAPSIGPSYRVTFLPSGHNIEASATPELLADLHTTGLK